MAKVLVVFGSKSDSDVYNRIVKILKKELIDYELRIISAHRTPEDIDEISQTDASLIISGAGLSAALPGVIASKTFKPIIGVPVHGNYQGLDALLSIAQMPPGIPVLAVGVSQSEVAAKNAMKIINREFYQVNIIGEKNHALVRKAESILKEFNIAHVISDHIDNKNINIHFVQLDEEVAEKDALVIYCPMVEKDDDMAEAALNFLRHSTHGLWVGLNRAENAALAAIEIMNQEGKYNEALANYRDKLRKKVKLHDAEERKKASN